MAFLNKVYTYQKHENFDAWLKTVGVPDDKIGVLASEKSTQKFEKNGDSYVVTTTSPTKGTKTITFKSGVEFDDTIGDDNIPMKTTFNVNGNTITQVVKTDKGVATFKRVFSGDDLVVEITNDKFDGVAKRYYKA